MRLTLPAIALLLSLGSAVPAQDTPAADEAAVKTVDVEIRGGLTLKVPESWKLEEPGEEVTGEEAELAQFVIPKADGDGEDGTLTLFNFRIGGGVKANIDLWVDEFQEEGRKSTVRRGFIGDKSRYFLVESAGTYLQTIVTDDQETKEPKPGYRMLGVILGDVEKGVYFLKMTGPDKTIAQEATSLRRSFGADAEKEQPVNLEDLN